MANVKGLAMQQTVRTLWGKGISQREIAKMLGISRNTVARYALTDGPADFQTEPPGAKVPTGSDSQTEPLGAKVPTGSMAEDTGRLSGNIPARSQSKCLPFEEIIKGKIAQELDARRIHQDLLYEHGFDGGYDSVKRFVGRLTEADGVPHRRMESPPGLEAQVDFGKGAWVVGEDGKRRKTHMLRVVLSNSRKGYTEVVFRQDTELFIRALENAFRHFGGAPATLVPDNLKAAVVMADQYDPELNPKLKSFADHYQVAVLPTPPRRPELKGKVERGVGYAFNSALKGRSFCGLAAQNKHLTWWEETVADTRIHGTTQVQVRTAFALEKPFLKPLPPSLFPCFEEGERIVASDGYVEVAKSYYSAPPEFLGRTVWVRWDTRTVRIFHPRDFRMVRIHTRGEPGQRKTHDGDISPRKISRLERGEHWMLGELETLDPHIHAWGKAMLQARGICGIRVLQGLLSLTRKVARSALSQACERATQMQMWKLRQVRQLATRPPTKMQPELPLTQAHPIIRDLADYTAALGEPAAESPADFPACAGKMTC